MKSKGLGRGLGALISENSTDENEKLLSMDVDKIKPNRKQPRKEFDSLKMNELMNSIQQYGIIQPIVVRSVVNGYEIIAGERRWRAAKNLNIGSVPVVVRKADDETGLLKLDEKIKIELVNGEITNGHARALLSLENKEDRLKILEIIIKRNYSVRKTENFIKNYLTKTEKVDITINSKEK